MCGRLFVFENGTVIDIPCVCICICANVSRVSSISERRNNAKNDIVYSAHSRAPANVEKSINLCNCVNSAKPSGDFGVVVSDNE